MKEYLYNYIESIDNLIKSKEKINDDIIKSHLDKISFFQHERLIHLLVTLFFALMFIILNALVFIHYMFFIAALIVCVILVFYILYYFFLENKIQCLYTQYDRLIEKKTINK